MADDDKPSQGDVERDIGLEAEARAVKYTARYEAELTRERRQGAARMRAIARDLRALAWRVESYGAGAMAAAREIEEFATTLDAGVNNPSRAGTRAGYWRRKLYGS